MPCGGIGGIPGMPGMPGCGMPGCMPYAGSMPYPPFVMASVSWYLWLRGARVERGEGFQ